MWVGLHFPSNVDRKVSFTKSITRLYARDKRRDCQFNIHLLFLFSLFFMTEAEDTEAEQSQQTDHPGYVVNG